jgi:TonB family protein
MLYFSFSLHPIKITPDVRAGLDHSLYWEAKPTGQDFMDTYPDRALRNNQGGYIRLHCRLTADGYLSNCTAEATPAGLGFEEAGLAMAKKFKMHTKTRDGTSVAGAEVVVPVRYVAFGERP